MLPIFNFDQKFMVFIPTLLKNYPFNQNLMHFDYWLL